MENEKNMKVKIQKDIKDLAKILGSLSMKYKDEPLLDDAQGAFLNLSVHVGKALDIQLQ